MFELIICAAASWSSSCQPERPVSFPNAYFCQRAAEKVLKQRKDVRQVYCRPKKGQP